MNTIRQIVIMINFITFGCWNKWYCDPRPGPMDALQDTTTTQIFVQNQLLRH